MKARKPWIIGGLIAATIVIGIAISIPVGHYFEQQRFSGLASKMDPIVTALKSAIPTETTWDTKATCDSIASGSYTTGEYLCGVTASTTVPIKTAEDITTTTLSTYETLTKIKGFELLESLTTSPSENFGKTFVTSSAESRHELNSSDMQCSYRVMAKDEANTNTFQYGIPLSKKSAELVISLDCSDITSSEWF